MTRITIRFTAKEIELLSTLASDQLFRREFIDSRLPSSKVNVTDVALGKSLVQRLQKILERETRSLSPKKDTAGVGTAR